MFVYRCAVIGLSENTFCHSLLFFSLIVYCLRLQDAEKREDELRGRLKQQQQMYEQVRADRNNYSKSLIESQDEIAEMKRKFKIMSHQVRAMLC